MILWYLKVDLEQTQRLVEREEGLSLAHKFNCSFYETSAAHRYIAHINIHPTPQKRNSFFSYSALILFRRHVDDVFHTLVREIRKRDEEGEFKENETSRWKKVWNNIFKTIKRGRRKVWENTFWLLSIFTSTAIKVLYLSTLPMNQISCLKALPNHESILNKSKIIFEICTKTMKLSELQKRGGGFLHPRHSQMYSWLYICATF